MCVKVASSDASSQRGQTTDWTVSAWATGGNVPDATIRLQATAAGGAVPKFSFGCGSDDGASCALGTIDAQSSPRQLQAQLTVPATASTVKSVTLTVIGSATHLPKAPTASATVTITAPPAPPAPPTTPTTAPLAPAPVTSPLSVTGLPGVPGVTATGGTLSPGGNAAGLFPTLNPAPTHSAPRSTRTSQAASTSALPGGAPVVGAQLAGLAALALGCVLAITRFSIRRRPVPAGQLSQDTTSQSQDALSQAPAQPEALKPPQPDKPQEPPASKPDGA